MTIGVSKKDFEFKATFAVYFALVVVNLGIFAEGTRKPAYACPLSVPEARVAADERVCSSVAIPRYVLIELVEVPTFQKCQSCSLVVRLFACRIQDAN